jgi:peptidyl-prolyl cis-trans isomerase D
VVEAITPNQRYAVLAVGRVIAAAPPPLAQIAPMVKADLARQRAAERARAVATALVAKINAGTPAARAFAEADVKLPAPQRVEARRVDIAQPNRPVPPPLALLFSLPKGKARLLPAPNGQGWFVVHLETMVAGDARSAPGLIEATRAQFQRFLGEEYAEQFARSIEKKSDIRRDEDAIRRTSRALSNGTAVQ